MRKVSLRLCLRCQVSPIRIVCLSETRELRRLSACHTLVPLALFQSTPRPLPTIFTRLAASSALITPLRQQQGNTASKQATAGIVGARRDGSWMHLSNCRTAG